MSAETPSISKEVSPTNVLVRRALKEGQDPSTQGLEVWNLTDEVDANGKRIATNPIATRELTVIPQDGQPSRVEKEHETKALSTEVLNPEEQYASAREYAGKPLRGDTVLADIDGSVKEVSVGELYEYTDGRTGQYAGVRDAFGNEVGVDSTVFSAEHQEKLRQRKNLADIAFKALEALEGSRRELDKMTLVEIQEALPKETQARDILELDTYATAQNSLPGVEGASIRSGALRRMSLAAQGVAARYAQLSKK